VQTIEWSPSTRAWTEPQNLWQNSSSVLTATPKPCGAGNRDREPILQGRNALRVPYYTNYPAKATKFVRCPVSSHGHATSPFIATPAHPQFNTTAETRHADPLPSVRLQGGANLRGPPRKVPPSRMPLVRRQRFHRLSDHLDVLPLAAHPPAQLGNGKVWHQEEDASTTTPTAEEMTVHRAWTTPPPRVRLNLNPGVSKYAGR